MSETYEEGLNGLERLKAEDNILTVDSEGSTSIVQKKMVDALKQEELQKKVQKMKEKFSASTSTSSTFQSSNVQETDIRAEELEGLLNFIIKISSNIFQLCISNFFNLGIIPIVILFKQYIQEFHV